MVNKNSKSRKTYRVVGIMSGTSLDGVDLAYCQFTVNNKKWAYKLLRVKTIKYSTAWKRKLASAHTLSSEALHQLDGEYGKYLGELCNEFIQNVRGNKVDLISSHGHTVFHQPEKGFTYQIGNGNDIYSATGITVVYNFRQLDVALNGQGAPLVPVGDRHLFADFNVCLNLGGIANLSFEKNKQRKAFDVCFTNMALNEIVKEADMEFDNQGRLASQGKVNHVLLKKITLLYDKLRPAKPSLSRELYESEFSNMLSDKRIRMEDRLRTFHQSIANEIEQALRFSGQKGKLLVTGGGAFNTYLISTIKAKLGSPFQLVIPRKEIIEFKEAIIFGFLGVLRLRNEKMCIVA
ncbi:MAG: anhydro-N-acetylmuramic acid kinase [Flammeovirgaceae bacterium]|nr:anhydro-N-acetylmuramic acid kinase [Flammeovirgaceae bacterium]